VDVNGGGVLEAVAVGVLGIVITAVTIATLPPAAPFVAKAFIAIGGGMATTAGVVVAYNN
jgi:hypothetical protein